MNRSKKVAAIAIVSLATAVALGGFLTWHYSWEKRFTRALLAVARQEIPASATPVTSEEVLLKLLPERSDRGRLHLLPVPGRTALFGWRCESAGMKGLCLRARLRDSWAAFFFTSAVERRRQPFTISTSEVQLIARWDRGRAVGRVMPLDATPESLEEADRLWPVGSDLSAHPANQRFRP